MNVQAVTLPQGIMAEVRGPFPGSYSDLNVLAGEALPERRGGACGRAARRAGPGTARGLREVLQVLKA